VAADIGVDDPPGSIDQEHAGGKPVQGIGQRGGVDLVQVDDLADQEGATHVRHHQLHVSARALVHHCRLADGAAPKTWRRSRPIFRELLQANPRNLAARPIP